MGRTGVQGTVSAALCVAISAGVPTVSLIFIVGSLIRHACDQRTKADTVPA
ncbi:MAG TPA: hypothetical protein VL966_12065 [Alphaproteobacteria bacterium]|jgi:hypothetical protein|nr:hypothetical protein [Alphaproteobacteria bacterium]